MYLHVFNRLTVAASLVTDAVRPAALLPLPDVYTYDHEKQIFTLQKTDNKQKKYHFDITEITSTSLYFTRNIIF